MFLIKITYLLAVIAFGILPLLIMWGNKLHKQKIHPIIKWKKTEAIILNIITFVLSLATASIAFFSLVIWLGEIYIPIFKNIPYDNFLLIASIGILLTIILIEIYYASLPFLQYYLLNSGIAFWKYNKREKNFYLKIIKWEDIADYHVKLDYPIKKFTFIVVEDPDNPFNIKTYKIDIPTQFASKIDLLLKRKLNMLIDTSAYYDDLSNIQEDNNEFD